MVRGCGEVARRRGGDRVIYTEVLREKERKGERKGERELGRDK
jgi:hypothetical protein